MNIINADQKEISQQTLGEDIKKIWREDPMQIVVQLFDKTLIHISRARATLSGWSDGSYQTHILNAVNVIEQLQVTLADDSESAMAANLDDIYRYVSRLLIESLRQRRPEDLNQAVSLLVEIREALSIFVKKPPQLLQH